MTLNLIIKQLKGLINTSINDVKFHSIDKSYLVITKFNGSKHFFKLTTVLEIREVL